MWCKNAIAIVNPSGALDACANDINLLIAKVLLLIAARSPESLYEVASTLHPETVVFQHTHTPEPSVPYSNVSGTATAIDTASGTRSGGW